MASFFDNLFAGQNQPNVQNVPFDDRFNVFGPNGTGYEAYANPPEPPSPFPNITHIDSNFGGRGLNLSLEDEARALIDRTNRGREKATLSALGELGSFEEMIRALFGDARSDIEANVPFNPRSDEDVQIDKTRIFNMIDQNLQSAIGNKAAELQSRGIRGGGQTSAAAGQVASAASNARTGSYGKLLSEQTRINDASNLARGQLLSNLNTGMAPFLTNIGNLRTRLKAGNVDDPSAELDLLSGLMGREEARTARTEAMDLFEEHMGNIDPTQFETVMGFLGPLVSLGGMEDFGNLLAGLPMLEGLFDG